MLMPRPVRMVRAASLTNYQDVARELGLDAHRILRDAGLGVAALSDPDLMIPAERVAQVLQRSAELSGFEAFGLHMAESRHLSNLGPVGMVVRDQPTLRESLAVLVRYHAALNGSLALMVEEHGDVVVVREEVLAGTGIDVRQPTELAIGVLLRLMRVVLGAAWQPRRVCFSHAAPRDLRVHRRVLGANVEFGSDFNGIVCSRAELDAPNPTADAQMVRYAERLLESALPSALGEASLIDDVRRTALLLLPSGRCTIEQVSAHLGVVCRTVQRRLAEQHSSFSELVQEIRIEQAERHVNHSDRALNDVAALLGFAAPSGFSRWFQQQFGCSPSQSRQRARSDGAR